MPHFICTACGMQYADTANPPAQCDICEEERQYVRTSGQGWTTFAALARSHRNCFKEHEPGVIGIGSDPAFAIGQRALLLQTRGGNVLWDCIAPLEPATVAAIKALGGIKAIAISHPHFYTTMIEWSRAFDGAPIYLHAADRAWVRRQDAAIKYWSGDTHALWDGVTLIRCGGHFPGAAVLHWVGGDGAGVVCSGDTLTVTTDRKWLSFMRSYPNFIPLSAAVVKAIGRAMAPHAFDRLYGHYFDRVIAADAKSVLEKSLTRYIAAVEGTRGYETER